MEGIPLYCHSIITYSDSGLVELRFRGPSDETDLDSAPLPAAPPITALGHTTDLYSHVNEVLYDYIVGIYHPRDSPCHGYGL